VTGNLKAKSSVLTTVPQNTFRERANRETAEDERASSKRYVLVSAIAPVPNFQHLISAFNEEFRKVKLLGDLFRVFHSAAPAHSWRSEAECWC
jgi:hypothetical protein